MRLHRPILVLPMALLALPGEEAFASGKARFESVSAPSDMPEAVAPASVRRMCADTEDQLRTLFAERGAPWDPDLVRRSGGERCHVDYAPTVPGFRADPDDLGVRELYMNVDGLSLLARRELTFGDSLDISKALVPRLPSNVRITLATRWALSDRWYQRALAFHFGEHADRIEWRRAAVASLSHPWTQDYFKSGTVDGTRKILVTRRLFEGRREDGESFAPMLDSLADERFVRSRLSWEGGDLQLVRHPRHPERLVLFHGDNARSYWGGGLTPEEYAYVLRREFGADLSVDLSGMVPHVDYLVAFLPADRIALVSQPVSGNREMAEAAAAVLEERFHGAPPATLAALRERLAFPDALSGGRKDVEKLLKRAKEEARKGWPRVEEPRLEARMARHIAAHCPRSPLDCFREESIGEFLATDPLLLRDWAGAALRERTESRMDLRLLSVIESQLARRPPGLDRIDAAVRTLEEMGFRVVRVPRFGGDRSLKVPWSGISYVNSLLVDRTLFVPRFGLGDAEETIFEELDAALPPPYEVVPVYARHMLLYNGGVHCAVAIVRD